MGFQRLAMITTRFAPSPTGDIHLGHVFAAKVAHDMARDAGGCFLLRQEDIDSGRVKPEFYHGIEEDLEWLGLRWDGEILFQSERRAAYDAALETLRAMGLIYPCFCTRKDIQAVLSAPHGQDAAIYPGTCRMLSAQETHDRIAAGAEHAWRFNADKAERIHGELTFRDLRFGVIHLDTSLNGDAILARKDIGVAYHLAVVVDDHFQNITHVTRGEDLFVATHIHRQLQAVLGYSEPLYLHHDLVRDESGTRLAKRDANRSIRMLRKQGLSADEVMAMLQSS